MAEEKNIFLQAASDSKTPSRYPAVSSNATTFSGIAPGCGAHGCILTLVALTQAKKMQPARLNI
jgi:hypothetical protein